MKKFINEAARALAPRIIFPGKGIGLGEQFRAFLVKATDERPELFDNAYLMSAAASLQEVYPVFDIEQFYEHKKCGDDHVFNAYEKALRAFASSGQPKDALRALRPMDIENRDRLHRMVEPEQFDRLGRAKGGIYEVLVEVDLLAGSSLASFLRSGRELEALFDVRYELTEVLEDLNISVETRDDYKMVMSNKDMLLGHLKNKALAKRVCAEVSRFTSDDVNDRVQLADLRGYLQSKKQEHDAVVKTPATKALEKLHAPGDLTDLALRLQTTRELEIADLKDIMDSYARDFAPFTQGAKSFEDLLALEQDSKIDFLAGMDANRVFCKLGRLPYENEKVVAERDSDGVIHRVTIEEPEQSLDI